MRGVAILSDICVVADCGRPRMPNRQGQRSAYCAAHKSRIWRTGTAQADVPVRGFGRSCTLPGCDRRHKGRGYCEMHLDRLRKTGDPLGFLARPKIDDPGYAAVHKRVRTERGRASGHACVSCDAPAAEWSYDHEDPNERMTPQGVPFSLDASHYRPMCISCHRAFDLSRKDR